MAVTTGTTTGTTNSSSGSSNNPTGGSLQAPARTEPSKSTTPSGNASTGQGGQGSTSSSSSTSSTPSSSGSSSGTSQSGTESSSNTTTDASTNTTTATKSEPSTDTALKSPTQQAEVNKQKEAYTDYGGAYTTIDAPPALPQASKQESAKVVDPARSSSSSNTTTGTQTTGSKAESTGASPQTAAPAKTSSQDTSSSAKPATTTPASPSGTSTAWGGGITAPQGSTYGKSPSPSAPAPSGTSTAWGGPAVPAPATSNASKQPTPTVAGLSGTSTIWGGPPVNQPVAQDPSIPGRAAQANQNYVTTTAPGGFVSTTYKDPDLAPSTSYMDDLYKGIQDAGIGLTVALGAPQTGPNRGLTQESMAKQLGDAAVDTYNKISGGISSGLTSAGNYVDSLFGPGIAPGATTEAMMKTPGMTPGNPAPNSGLSYQDPTAVAPAGGYFAQGSIIGNAPIGPQTLSQAVTGDYAQYGFQPSRNMSPVTRTPDQAAIDAAVQDPTNMAPASPQAVANIMAAQNAINNPAPPKIADRVPPQAPNYPTVTDPRTAQMQEQLGTASPAPAVASPSTSALVGNPLAAGSLVSAVDKARQDAFNKIAAARGQTAKIVDTPVSLPGDPPTPPMQGIPAPDSLGIMPGIADPRMAQMQEQRDIGAMQGSMLYPGADGITPNDIGGVFENGALVDPTSAEGMTVEDMVQALTPQPTTPVRQGMVNPFYRSPAEQAQAVQNSVAVALGPRPPAAPMPPAPSPQVVAPQPVAPRQPTSINISGGNVPMDPSVMGRNAQAIANQSVAPSQQMPTGPIGAQGGLGVQAYPGVVQTPPLNVPTNSSTAQRDQYYGGGPTETLGPVEDVPPQQASPVTVTNPEAPVPPSQEGDYPPNENPSQVAGQPQSISEWDNRYEYEKQKVVDTLKKMPGDLFNAIISGDIRGYTPDPNDRGTDPLPYGIHPGTPGTGNSAMLAQQAALINRLVAMLRQQQLGVAPSQADLVFNTFV